MTDILKRTALYDDHESMGAKLVEFGGWEMPLSYESGTVAEHRACRESAVVFDVSHLGTVTLRGDEAYDTLQSVLTNDLTKVNPGRAQYTHLLDDEGSVLDDIIIWWRGDDEFDVMPNASNTDRVTSAIGGTDVTASRSILAIQGPEARSLLASISPDAAAVGRFHVAPLTINGVDVVVAGTGYTGEDGVEIAVPNEAASELFQALVHAGVMPAGLGARDTLRLEAGLPLHGHELGPGITPLQANLGWVVGWNKPTFRGKDALLAERDAGPRRTLKGFQSSGRQPLRDHAAVIAGGTAVGETSSGNFSPMLGCGIALGFVESGAQVSSGDAVQIAVRGRSLDAHIVPYPFWPPRSS
jgi:aminomethyltransferase